MPRSATTQARLDAEAAAQALDHRQQCGDIGGVAGPEEGGDGPIILIQHDAQNDLMQLRAEILRVARRPSVAPPRPSKYSEVVSKKATDSAPNSDLR